YTKENGIMGNTQTQVYYTPTNLDSAKAISDRLGDQTITTHSISHSGKMFEKNVSDSETGRKLMKPEEIMTMPKNKEIVFTGDMPVYAGKIRWFVEPFFQRRVYDPPKNNLKPLPFSDTCTPVQTFGQLFAMHAAEGIETAEKIRFVKEARALAAQKAQQPEGNGAENGDAGSSNTANEGIENQATFTEAQPDIPAATEKQEMEAAADENCVGESSEVEIDDERESEDFVCEDDGADGVEGNGDVGQQPLENEKPESTVEAPSEINEAAPAVEAPETAVSDPNENAPGEPQADNASTQLNNVAFAAWKQKAMKKMAEKGTKKAGA
ncbi:MAG: type IV secretory system conjugative DNA transfer family protein, partial [Schwartzia sp.]|nr:type IV secretory system conjugative DNA transfer family protein [Schwartzia sp. (in: firmicutes)]